MNATSESKNADFGMPIILVIFVWLATADYLIATFYGFSHLTQPPSFIMDLFSAFVAFGVVAFAVSTSFLFRPFWNQGWNFYVWRIIWLIFLILGGFSATRGNLALIHPSDPLSDEPPTRTFVIFRLCGFVAVTTVAIILTMMHSALPEKSTFLYKFFPAKPSPPK